MAYATVLSDGLFVCGRVILIVAAEAAWIIGMAQVVRICPPGNLEVREHVLPVDREGLVNPEDVRRAIRPETVLITLMLANNEIGTIEPIEEIGKIAAEKGITFHTDAVQAAGKIPIDVDKLGVHLLSISAHKFSGPKGVGALYIRKGTQLGPLMYGGHSERDRRPGTEDVAAIAGMGKAADLAVTGMRTDAARVRGLRDRLEQGLLDRIPCASVNGSRTQRTPNTTNLTFPGVEGEAMVIATGSIVTQAPSPQLCAPAVLFEPSRLSHF